MMMNESVEEKWNAVKTVPKEYLSKIDIGALKGKSNINPQWRIKVMTEVYGLCGVGWRYEVTEKDFHENPQTGEKLIFLGVSVYVKDGKTWSNGIVGYGGEFILQKNKHGLVCNDEAYKMCLTDALGNALKNLGVASEIYEGEMATKYQRQAEEYKESMMKKINTEEKAVDPYLWTISKLKDEGITNINEFTDAVTHGAKKDFKQLTVNELKEMVGNLKNNKIIYEGYLTLKKKAMQNENKA